MADRIFNNYSVPDHLVGDEKEDPVNDPRVPSVRQSEPTLDQAYLEMYYSQPSKTPDHLDGTARYAPSDPRVLGDPKANVQELAGDAVTEKSIQVGDDSDAGSGLGMVDAALDEAGVQRDTTRREEYSIASPDGGYLEPTEMPLSWTNRRDKDMQWMMDNPALMKTMLESGTTPAEISQVVDFDYARQTARTLYTLTVKSQAAAGSVMGNQLRQRANAIMRNLNPNMRMVVESLMLEQSKEVYEAQRAEFFSPKNRTSTVEPRDPSPQVIQTGGDVFSAVWNSGFDVNWILDRLSPQEKEWVINFPLLSVTEEGRWRLGVGGSFDTLMGIVDVAQQGVKAGLKQQRDFLEDPSSILDEPFNVRKAWNAVQEGAIDPEAEQELVRKYGAKNVRMIFQLHEWHQQGEDAMAKAIEEYADDPDATALVLMLTDVSDGSGESQEIANLVRDFGYATNDNWFNILTGNQYINPVVDSLKGPTNVFFDVAVDPIWLAGKPLKAIKYARYSTARLATAQNEELDMLLKLNPGDLPKSVDKIEEAGLLTYDVITGNAIPTSPAVTKMFNRPKVRRVFNAVGAELKRIDSLENTVEKGSAFQALQSNWKKFFPEEMLREMSRQKVYSAEEAMYWYHDNSLVASVLGGKGTISPPSSLMPKVGTDEAAELTGAAVVLGDAQPLRKALEWDQSPYALMNLGQKAAGKPLFPNISLQSAATKRITGAAKLASLKFVAAPTREALDTLVEQVRIQRGADEMELSGDEGVAIMQVFTQFPELTAAVLSDFSMYAKTGEAGRTAVSPENLDAVLAFMKTQQKASASGAPVLNMENTVYGALFNFLRSKRNEGKGRSAVNVSSTGAKTPKSPWKFPGRTLYVNGKDQLEGKPLNNTVGRKRKDVLIAPTAKQLFDPEWWRKNLWHNTARRVDRWSRMAARYPNRTLLEVQNSKSGKAVYEYARAWGMPSAMANTLREIWATATPAQRKNIASALAESSAYSRGIPYLFKNPEDAQTYVKSLRTGDDSVSMYSSNVLSRYEEAERRKKMLDLAESVAIARIEEARRRGDKELAERNLDELAEEIFVNEVLPDNNMTAADFYNAAVYVGPDGKRTTAALHGWQTSNTVILPDIAAYERLMARQSVFSALLGNNPFWENIVNLWSFGTLAGPRYQLRAALEDFAFYGLTNEPGAFYRYFKGQSADEALRLARGETPSWVKRKLGGTQLNPDTPWSPLDPLAVRMSANFVENRALAKWLRPADEAEAKAAMADLNMGNRETLIKLMNKLKTRQAASMISNNPTVKGALNKLANGRGDKLTEAQERSMRYLDELVEIEAGLFRFNQVSEGGSFITNGTTPLGTGQQSIPGMRRGVVMKRGEVKVDEIPNLNDAATSKQFFEVWGRTIFSDIASGGPQAQAALRKLDDWVNGDVATQNRVLDEMEDVFDSMPESYKTNFRMVEDLGDREYLRRYMDDMANTFGTRDGAVNRELLDMLRVNNGTKEGYFDPSKATLDNLSQIGKTDDGWDVAMFPRTIYDQYGVLTVQIAENMGVTQRGYAAMGNSLSRTSREPMWMANYLLARKELSAWEEGMSKQLQIMGMDKARADKLAGKRAADIGSERAMNQTLSFTDNPNNRSMLAWQVRNVSRYWRAQEDLFRRLGRTARYRPMAIWRGALIYNAMNESGFLWEDNQGDKYFIYPGADVVLNALASLGQTAHGASGVKIAGLPTTMTGKLNMLTPSADPNAMFPTFTPGMPTLAWELSKLLETFAPNAQKAFLQGARDTIEPIAFGEYGAPEGLGGAVPYNWRRLGEWITSVEADDTGDLREGVVADSIMISLRALVAADQIPDNLYSDGIETENFMKQVEQVSYWVAAARVLFGFVEPSRADYQSAVPSDFARSIGISGFRPEFIDLMNSEENDWATAMSKWIKLFPNLAPYTFSSTEATTRGGIVEYGRSVASMESVKFLRDNQDLLDIYPTALPYLAPEGVSTPEAFFDMSKLNLSERKTVETRMQDVIFARPAREVTAVKIAQRKADEEFLALYENGDISQQEYEEYVDANEMLADEKIEEIRSNNELLEEYEKEQVELPSSVAADRSVKQFREATATLRDNDVFIEAGVGNLNKVEVAEAALREFDEAKVELSKIAATADQLGVTEARRQEKKVIKTFTALLDDNFGFMQGAETGSIQDFAERYMLPVLNAVYKEDR